MIRVQMSEQHLAQVLVCACNPTKNYASRATFNAHKKSLRHTTWELNNSNYDLRTLLASREREIARLNKKIMLLEKRISLLAMSISNEHGA